MEANNKRTAILLIAVLMVTPVVAGCFGSDDAPKASADDQGENVQVINTDGPDATATPAPTVTDHSGAKNDPAAHFHHYWSQNGVELESVVLYSGPVPFVNMQTRFFATERTLAWAEFGLEDDKDDVPSGTSQPVVDGKADTVFAGTDRIVVTFPEADQFPPGVDRMRFFYKPSNSAHWLPEGSGITVEPGKVQVINLNQVGMADPPHQFTTSRWKFLLLASSELCGAETGLQGDTCPPAFINDPGAIQSGVYSWGDATSGLFIEGFNGGEKALDPPHPDFWTEGDVRDMEGVEIEITEPVAQTAAARLRANDLTDIAIPNNNIVPLGTQFVEVRLKYTNDAATEPATAGTAPFQFVLKYHGADTLDYQVVPPAPDGTEQPVADGDWLVYRIYDEDEIQVDPPYESNSFWRFQLVPATVGPDGTVHENTGVFQGKINMEFSAHKKPDFVLE